MGQPHPNYRANDSRSIFVTGAINQELIDRLTPQIRALRSQSSQPITVYVDSPGGGPRLGAMFNDFSFGPHRQFLEKFVAKRWRLYVTDEERLELETRFEKEKDGQKKLLEHMGERMESLWHFVYSLCKRLQQSENPLSATDAYWLGIVDEVLGTQLPCVRELVENAPEASRPGAEPT